MIRSIEKTRAASNAIEEEFRDVIESIRSMLTDIPYEIIDDNEDFKDEDEVEEDYGE